jgi:hypothetical protein
MYEVRRGIVRSRLGLSLLTLVSLCVPMATSAEREDLERKIDGLIEVLREPYASAEKCEENRKAIAALVAIGRRAVPKLTDEIVRNPGSYAHLALDEIGKDAVALVRAKWLDLDEASRWKLMDFRGKHDYADTVEFAVASLHSNDEEIRALAIQYLAKHKETKAREALFGMYHTATGKLRFAALQALQSVGHEDVEAILIGLLKPDSWIAKGEGLGPFQCHPPPWWPDGRG